MQFQQALLPNPGQAAEQAAVFSRMTQLNIWMWHYGRAFPRKISVEDADSLWRRCGGSVSKNQEGRGLKP
jgi:hypothetical protein